MHEYVHNFIWLVHEFYIICPLYEQRVMTSLVNAGLYNLEIFCIPELLCFLNHYRVINPCYSYITLIHTKVKNLDVVLTEGL